MFAELFPDAVRTTPTIGRMALVGLALSHNFLQRPPRLHQRRVLRFGSDSVPPRADGSVPISVWRQVD